MREPLVYMQGEQVRACVRGGMTAGVLAAGGEGSLPPVRGGSRAAEMAPVIKYPYCAYIISGFMFTFTITAGRPAGTGYIRPIFDVAPTRGPACAARCSCLFVTSISRA